MVQNATRQYLVFVTKKYDHTLKHFFALKKVYINIF